MEYKSLMRDAGGALKKAIDALQTGESIEATIREARKWLDAARIASTSEDERDEIHLWECYASCLTNDFDRAYEQFRKVNAGREVAKPWQEIGTIIYTKMTLPADLAEGLREFDMALNWEVLKAPNPGIAPVKAILYGRKAFYHLKVNRYADAEASCEISSDLLPEHLAPLRIMAEIKIKEGDHDRAIRYLSKVIAIRTEGPHFWDHANRGTAFLETGNLQEALRDLRTALELDPHNAVVLSNLGMAFEHGGNLTEAWRCYSLALTHDFHSVPAHNNRGTLFFGRQEYRQAEREFSIAVELEPSNPILWFNRGLARFEMQMYGECLSDIGISIRLGNQAWEARYIMGMCKGRLKEYSTAIAILQNLVLRSNLDREDDSLIWNNIGVMEHRMDRLETAYSCFLASADENPLNEQAQANIGRIKATMSGTSLQPTEESEAEIAPSLLGLTRSEIFNTVNIASSLASMASQHLT